MSGALKPQPLLDEIAAQDALAHQFRKLGLEFSGLQPTIRTVMKRAVIATGDVRQQVERFILVARLADQQDLSDQEKRHVLEKAYERYSVAKSGKGDPRVLASPGADAKAQTSTLLSRSFGRTQQTTVFVLPSDAGLFFGRRE